MTDALVVGGGPAGLSAALFTAKNDLDTVVFDTDQTWMHKAHLYNYLGIDSVDGTAFTEDARDRVREFGADYREEQVREVVESDGGFTVSTEDGEHEAPYLVLATGAKRDLAESLGCEFTEEDIVDVGVNMETSVDDAYATGAMVRAEEWQAIIAAGDGAAAALNILSKEKGEGFHDFDVPEEEE